MDVVKFTLIEYSEVIDMVIHIYLEKQAQHNFCTVFRNSDARAEP